MIVEQIQPVDNEDEANDMLAGWRALPYLRIAYIRELRSGQLELVGLWECSDLGQLQPGQSNIKKVLVADTTGLT